METSPRLLPCETHYQMSNRFAWSWKLAELGKPVVLVYLGFLCADEMADQGESFPYHAAWERAVHEHSQRLFPQEVWGQQWLINGVPFIPLILSTEEAIA